MTTGVSVTASLPLPPARTPAALIPSPPLQLRPARRRRGKRTLIGKRKKVRVIVSPSVPQPVRGFTASDSAFSTDSCAGRVSPGVHACVQPDCPYFQNENFLFKLSSYLVFGSVSSMTSTALLSFNSAVWTDRCNFFASQGDDDKLDIEQAAHHIARTAALGYLGASTKKPKGFGRAGSRTDLQTTQARVYAQNLLDEVPTGEVIAFTDGASRGNPGPAGAGTTLYIKDCRALPFDDYAPLGINTNNLAELWAIGMAITRVAALPTAGRPYKLNIFTDSTYSIGCLDQGYVSKTNKKLVRALRRLLQTSTAELILQDVSFFWVPGHAGLAGNDMADHLANCGADASKGGTITIDIDNSLPPSSFLYT